MGARRVRVASAVGLGGLAGSILLTIPSVRESLLVAVEGGTYSSRWLMLAEGCAALALLSLGAAAWMWLRGERRATALGRTLADRTTALERERAFSRMILESSRDAFLAWDSEGVIVEASASAEKLFGWTVSELRGRSLRDLLDWRHHDEYDRRVTAARDGRAQRIPDRPIALKARRRDGSTFRIEIVPFEASLKEQTLVAAMVRDVTERARIERERLRSESLRVLLEELPDAVMVHRNQRLLYVNKRFLEALGFERADEVRGRSIRQYVHPDDWERVEGRLRRLEATGKAVERAEERFCGANGIEATWEVAKVPVHFDGLPAIVTLGRDLSARRLADRRLRQAVESTPSGMLMIDRHGRILLVNRQVEQLFGYSEADLVGQPVEILVPERSRREHPALRALYVSQPSARPMGNGRELFGLHADGSEIPVEIGLNPLQTEEGLCVLCSVVDISERKKTQIRMQLADRLATVGTLAAGVAHGINNPLSFVKGNLVYALRELSERGDPGDESASADPLSEICVALEQAAEGADRIRDIVADLLTFSRQATDDGEQAGTDVHEVLESVLQMTANELRPRAVVEKRYGRVPSVRGDASRLAHAFTNLLVNAAHALPEGEADRHSVSVATSVDEASGFVVTEIVDSGHGMDADTLSRAFEPFFTTKEVGSGTGLGLSVTHGIVTDLGGRIEIESAPGRGTRVRVSLPPALATPKPAQGALPARRRIRVLVVDDERGVLDVFGRLLREDEVVKVSSGADALARIHSGERFDVIFCDLIMPGRMGAGVYEELAAAHPDQARRMVFMTGGAFTADSRAFIARVPTRLIPKPPDLPDLEEAIAAVLAQVDDAQEA